MIITCFLLCLLLFPYIIFRKPPKPTASQHYDFILVLGCPTLADGTLSTLQKQRLEATACYVNHRYCERVVISGGAVQNEYGEAIEMAHAFQTMCPNCEILTETNARNTFQNLKFAKEQFGGNHILVITSPSHLRRAYFFTKKFYPHAHMGCGEQKDAWYAYLWEYTRMWVALYWEVRLAVEHKQS